MRYLLYITILLPFLWLSCQSDSEKQQAQPHSTPTPQPTQSPAPKSSKKRLLERGGHIAQAIQQELSALLIKKIRDQGPDHAVHYCSKKAIPLTDSLSKKFGVTLQRVSHKPRNPENKTNGEELKIIQNYISQLKKGQSLTPALRKQSDGSHTYFAPIVIKNTLCLNCHGDPKTDIQPKTLAVIEQRYPTDSAKGFSLNELRGIWRINFPK